MNRHARDRVTGVDGPEKRVGTSVSRQERGVRADCSRARALEPRTRDLPRPIPADDQIDLERPELGGNDAVELARRQLARVEHAVAKTPAKSPRAGRRYRRQDGHDRLEAVVREEQRAEGKSEVRESNHAGPEAPGT